MTLGERFKAARRMKGYSQTSVAKALGLCQGTISWLESGRARGATVRYYWRRLQGALPELPELPDDPLDRPDSPERERLMLVIGQSQVEWELLLHTMPDNTRREILMGLQQHVDQRWGFLGQEHRGQQLRSERRCQIKAFIRQIEAANEPYEQAMAEERQRAIAALPVDIIGAEHYVLAHPDPAWPFQPVDDDFWSTATEIPPTKGE